MLTNCHKLALLFILIVLMSLLTGCARKWITADGREIVLSDHQIVSLDICEKKREHYLHGAQFTSAYECLRFSNLIIEVDPVNALKYFKKGCVEAKSYGCFHVIDDINKMAVKGTLTEPLFTEFRDVMLNMCLSDKYNSRDGYVDQFCDYLGNSYQTVAPVSIDKSIKAYNKSCKLSGGIGCFHYEELSGIAVSEADQERFARRGEQDDADREAASKREFEQDEQNSRRRQQQADQERQNIMNAVSAFSQTAQGGDSISQALQNQNRKFESMREQISQKEEQQSRDNEDRVRETREAQLRRAEDAATQRHDADEKRRLQQKEQEQRNRELLALERSQKDEADRRQRQEDQQRQAQQKQYEEQQQTKSKKPTIPGGRYDNCIQQGFNEADLASFPDAYFLNTCGETLHVKHILADGSHSGSWNYEPGKKSGIGGFCGKKCVDDAGGFYLAVCPQGWIAKASDGSYWGSSSNFRQGYYCEQQD